MGELPPAQPELICSARGCRNRAEWALRWRNPRLHDEQRRKTWLACAQHRGHLGDFLRARGFLREEAALGPTPSGTDVDPPRP